MGKSMQTESRPMVTRDWLGVEGKEREGNNCFVALMFYCEGGDNVLELYRGGGCLTLCVKK